MKPYVLTTGIIFAVLTVAHLWRIFSEDPRLAHDPFFVSITALAAALCLWSVVVLWRARQRKGAKN